MQSLRTRFGLSNRALPAPLLMTISIGHPQLMSIKSVEILLDSISAHSVIVAGLAPHILNLDRLLYVLPAPQRYLLKDAASTKPMVILSLCNLYPFAQLTLNKITCKSHFTTSDVCSESLANSPIRQISNSSERC